MNSTERLISAQSLAILSCLAFVAGGMALLIAHCGSPTPWADQWDLEADGVYKLYLEGRLGLSYLVTPHVISEHRMFFTRTLALALFELRGGWDPVWEMVAGIGFRLLAISLMLAFLLNRLISAPQAIAVAFLCAVLAAVPFASETVLMGYPSNFYLALIFSFSAFLLLDRSAAWSVRWWIGTLLAVLSYFNLASGTFTLFAVDAVICLQIILGVRPMKGLKEYAGLTFHLVLIVLMFAAVPATDVTAFRAESIAQFEQAAAILLAWPLPPPFMFLIYGPTVIFSGMLLVRRPSFLDDRWSYVILLAWLVLQLAALAYGRGSTTVRIGIAPRYTDILGISVLLNFAMVLYFCRAASIRRARLAYALAAIWIGTVCFGGAIYAEHISGDVQYVQLQTRPENIKPFIETGDVSLLAGKAAPDIPYPNSAGLIRVLSDPLVQKILPSNLIDEEDAALYIQPRTFLRGTFSHAAVRTRDWVLQNGFSFLAAGLALLMLALMRSDRDWNTPPYSTLSTTTRVVLRTLGGLLLFSFTSFLATAGYNLRASRTAIANATTLASTLLPVTGTDAALVGTLDLLKPERDGRLKTYGWAFNRADPRQPVFVAVALDGKVAAVAQTTVARPDVSKDYKLDQAAAPSGFLLLADACSSDVVIFAFTMEGHARVLPHADHVACPEVRRGGAPLPD